MSDGRIGLWLIGAWGALSTATAVRLAALKCGLLFQSDLISAETHQVGSNPISWEQLFLGGHEIRRTSYFAEANALLEQQRDPFDRNILDNVKTTLAEFDRNIRTGTMLGAGPACEALASTAAIKHSHERATTAIDRIEYDLKSFRDSFRLQQMILCNAATAEPPLPEHLNNLQWSELIGELDQNDNCIVRASSIYAIAAMRCGCAYLNLTPSVGSELAALHELAEREGVLHAGRDILADDLPSAASQVVELSLLIERERRLGTRGVMPQLSSFFRSPLETRTSANLSSHDNRPDQPLPN